MDNCIAVTGIHAIAYWLSDRSRALDDAFNESQGEDHGKCANFMAYRDGIAVRPESLPVPDCAPHLEHAEAAALSEYFGQPLPIQVAIGEKGKRRDSGKLTCHILQEELLKNQFLKLSDRVLIATPECALLQMACSLNELELTVLITLLCSIFTYDRGNGGRLIPRRRVCSLESVRAFLEACQKDERRLPHGFKRLKRAAEKAVEGAASPPEMSCALRAALPKRMSGYAFGPAECNKPIEIGDKTRYADIFLPEKQVWIEYASDIAHSSNAARKADERRRNEIVSEGYTVFTLTGEHYVSSAVMDVAAGEIGRVINRRFDKSDAAKETREALRREIELLLERYRSWAMIGR